MPQEEIFYGEIKGNHLVQYGDESLHYWKIEITSINEYNKKSKYFDCLWLLENVILLATGID